jgi:hypothetical protein
MKIFFVSFAFLVCTAASATSCVPDATCDLSKVREGFLALVIVTKNVCVQMNPSRAEQYTEAFQKMLNQAPDTETREWIHKTMNSPEFISKVKEGELNLEESERDKLLRECPSFLGGAW